MSTNVDRCQLERFGIGEHPPTDDLTMLEAAWDVTLDPDAVAALDNFRRQPPNSGVLVISGVDHGNIGPTPTTPVGDRRGDVRSNIMLLAVAAQLGEPVGYLPELGGRVVQNIVPTPTAAQTQTSTSSAVELAFHTETAFHPNRPRYLVLSCLRGDPAAATTFASIFDIIEHVGADVENDMRQPWYRTAVDASFLNGRRNVHGQPRPLLTGPARRPTFVFDAELTAGVDERANNVVAAVNDAISQVRWSVTLEAGDIAVIDNNLTVHGRSPFIARFDGTDRWLQRTFVVDALQGGHNLDGRVYVNTFGEPVDN